jgi:uncharacterized protein YbjQ (UPF0145 family)
MLVVTTNDLPGYRILEVRGLVIGTTPRPRNKFMEGVRPLRVDRPRIGEQYLSIGRNEAVERMVEHARERGANAVLNVRFEHRSVSEQWVELCAYGTSVVAEPLPVPPHRARARALWSMRSPRPLPSGTGAGTGELTAVPAGGEGGTPDVPEHR